MPPDELDQVIDGELVAHGDSSATLFRTGDPALVVARAVELANVLRDVIVEQKLFVTIHGKRYVKVEGWTLAGTILGVFPVLVWTRRLDDGWEARVEARTRDGHVVGAAESECLRSEARWANADDYAVRSMAATRTTSKALRQPLGFVISMAGYEATPAEEIPADDRGPRRADLGVREGHEDRHQDGGHPASTGSPAAPVEATPEQLVGLGRLIERLTKLQPETNWRQRAQEITGLPDARLLTVTGAQRLLEKLQAHVDTLEAEPAA